MAALLRDVTNVSDHHPSNTTSKSVSASPTVSPTASASPSTTPITSSQLCEGLDGKIQEYQGIAEIGRAVRALSKKLRDGETTDQYLVFRPVTEKERDEIDNQRYKIGKGIRLTHCADIGTLIIKVPTTSHEVVSRSFGDEFVARAMGMQIPRQERVPLGSATFRGTSTSKEADGAFKPATLRPHEQDWPTLVLEVGASESLRKLRNDARWWLSNSGGNVNIVLIFHINRGTKSMLIEKWETRPATGGPATRSNRPPAQIPTQIQAITIDQNNITGTPLTLPFHGIFLRQPAQQADPSEQDLVFTTQDLRDWSDDVWAALT
ncbi:hypothetical protein PRK78_001348 [Emydomyces testavorans]|uniref:Uncharacterized protein n=1 Tax=Emydomyces testavorans TaxID=2070801 RepID=A0AAF0DCT1_9EURO|nr:hypothetical protein PRK78_001348 [Emydomyces testavorans]